MVFFAALSQPNIEQHDSGTDMLTVQQFDLGYAQRK